MGGFFHSVAKRASSAPKATIAVWAVILAASVLIAPDLDKHLEGISDDSPGSDSSHVSRVLIEEFPGRFNQSMLVVFKHPQLAATDPNYSSVVNRTFDMLLNRTEIKGGFSAFYPLYNPRFISSDGHITYIAAGFVTDDQDKAGREMPALSDAIRAAVPPGFEVYATGAPAALADIQEISSHDAERAESFSIPLAIIVLIIILGGLLASFLPLGLGFVAILTMFGIAALIAPYFSLSVYVRNIGLMLGLGLGIDYSLLIVSRFKEELAREMAGVRFKLADAAAGTNGKSSPVDEDALVRAASRRAAIRAGATAGRAVAFSGFTVALGFLALLAPDIPLIRSIGLGGLIIVATSVAVAITLLPALLVLLGPAVEWPRRLSAAVVKLRRPGFWQRAARRVLAHPKAYLAVVLALLVPLSLFSYVLTPIVPGPSSLPAEAPSRLGLDLFSEGFGPGAIGPIVILVKNPSGSIYSNASIDAVDALTRILLNRSDIANVSSITRIAPGANASFYKFAYLADPAAIPDPFTRAVVIQMRVAAASMVSRQNDSTIVTAYLAYDSSLPASHAVVKELREAILPGIAELQGFEVLVGGTPANAVDTNDATYNSLLVVIVIVLLATYIVLLFLFRSVVLPLKTILENVLSVTASIGFLVLIFEFGLGTTLFGFKTFDGVTFAIPVVQFALLFGLSMDYQIFILSRVKEEYDATHDNDRAVVFGLEKTGGVVTSAALVMITVFGLFSTSNLIFLKELGLGLAFAVFVDATLVRTVAVPAGMKLLAHRNWYLPEWLDRRLPEVRIEEEGPAEEMAAAADHLADP